MNEVYEYRRAPSRGAIWLAAITVVMLFAAITFTGAKELTWLAWGLGAITLCWMLLPKPVAGIRVDDDFLILSAWRNPIVIRLDDIAYLRATDVSAETDIAIVYKDGTEEGTFSGDMPDLQTVVEVMAKRGIAVRDVF